MHSKQPSRSKDPLAALLRLLPLALCVALLAGACSSSTEATNGAADETATDGAAPEETGSEEAVTEDPQSGEGDEATAASSGSSSFTAEVWADNWFALYVNGELVGEDSVPITTERSFNAETMSFDADYPLTIAIEAKDFKETDSGIEYIGEGNQQMGDGGIIAQITDTATGSVIAVTAADWSTLVIHRAPLNTDCEKDSDPDSTCEFESSDAPAGWQDADFDDSGWDAATEWSEADVSPKDGYDEINWDGAAELIWGTDLEVDNTVLLRLRVGG